MMSATRIELSIIIPTLNEEANIADTLSQLQAMRERGVEIIVADGGSHDATVAIATPLCDKLLTTARGRARQMNAGAELATGAVLLFLHADSQLSADADLHIARAISRGADWGRFDVTITGSHWMLPIVAWMMNHRSRLTDVATGDQGIFVTRQAFAHGSGFADQPLMEDIAFSTAMKKAGFRAVCLRTPKIITSGRRWERHGTWRTILLMWRLRLQYYLGADVNKLYKAYYGK
jgi:rSAM/selenodomain-associated transferase 2